MELLGSGIFNADGDDWTLQRKVQFPCFGTALSDLLYFLGKPFVSSEFIVSSSLRKASIEQIASEGQTLFCAVRKYERLALQTLIFNRSIQ
jgi:hypothetical protein